MVHTCNHRTEEAKAGGLRIPGIPWEQK
jgi:hypothetical protein